MRISQKIPCRPEIITEFLSAIVERIKTVPISEADVFKVKLALGEALANAVKHGRVRDTAAGVQVDVDVSPRRIICTVRDEGEGFDFEHLPDPTRDENLEKGSGRGVYLIRSLMDRVSFSDCGREITMVKFL